MFAPIPVSTSTNYSQIYILTTKIWMLGKQFDPEIVESTDTGDTPTVTATGNTNNTFTFNQFLYEFSQKTWFSYRRDFLPIEDTPYLPYYALVVFSIWCVIDKTVYILVMLDGDACFAVGR